MIFFFADNHYGAHPGKNIFVHLPDAVKSRMSFCEDDFSLLESGNWLQSCELLILHLIGGTCGLEHPGAGAEKSVREWCMRGGGILLLHGASAAFWQWSWWRKNAGLRWVRQNDPDGLAPSSHPRGACKILPVAGAPFPAEKLAPVILPEDEIYTNLRQTGPLEILMTTEAAGRVWPQCCISTTEWGGRVAAFIPGHKPECASNPELVANVNVLIEYLLKKNCKGG